MQHLYYIRNIGVILRWHKHVGGSVKTQICAVRPENQASAGFSVKVSVTITWRYQESDFCSSIA